MGQYVWHHVLNRFTDHEVCTMIFMCSAITQQEFLRFFDDIGPEALSVVRAKLQNTSCEVVLDGVYQQHRSLRCFRIRACTIQTLDGIPGCVDVPLSVLG
jgi:hypothetical protein